MSILMPNDSCRADGLPVMPPGTNSLSLPVPVPPPNSMSNSIPISAAGMSGVFLTGPQVVSTPGPMQLPITHHTSNKMSMMADPMQTEKHHPPIPNNPDYLAQLLNDKNALKLVPNMFMHVERIIEEEINKVRKSMYNINDSKPLMLPDPVGPTTTLSEKLFVPVKTYPDFNFVGRILGPRGMYAKQLEKETGCKIMVRGRGSIRDKKKEEQNKGKPNWEHLEDDLHVLVTVEDTQNRAALKMERAVSQIKKLLVPTADGEDELKKRQLMELAIINGTFRDTTSKPHQTSNPNTPLTSPRQMIPPGTALIPQPLRSPTPATHPHQLLAHHPAAALFPRMASGQTLLANGMAPPMVSTADGSGFMFSPYEHYPYAVTPTMLDYPPTPSEGQIGAVPKLRRTIREHPYQRVLDTREIPGMVLGATLPLSNHLMS